jgi:hypothetical protein
MSVGQALHIPIESVVPMRDMGVVSKSACGCVRSMPLTTFIPA